MPATLAARTLTQLVDFLDDQVEAPLVLPILSMVDRRRRLHKELVESLAAEDKALVVDFSDKVFLLEPLTDDREALRRAIQSISAVGATAIYDAALDAWWPLVGSAGVPATVVAGTTHAAIVAAVLEASTTTHRLYFPAGVYNPTAQIDLTGIWSIRGDGPGLSVIRPSSSLTVGSAWIFRRFAAATLAGFRIEGVTIDANNLGTNSALRMSWVDDFVMRDCEILNVAGGWGVMIGVDDSSIEVAARNHRVSFERCRFDGLGATSTFEQLLVFNTDALSVKECTFGGVVNSLGNSLGLWQGVTNASVLDCSFGLGGRNAYVGLSCNDVTFERNLFEGAQAAIRVGGLPDNGDWGHHVVRGLKVRGNTFRQAAGIAAPDRDRCLYLGGCEDFTVSDNTFEGSYGPATWLGINGAVIVGDQRYSSQGRIADNHYRNCIQGAASHDLNPPIRVDTPSGAFAVNLLVTGNTFTDDQVTKTQYRNLIVAGAGAVTDLTVIGNDWDTTIVGTAPVAKVTGTVTLGDRVRIDSGSTDAQAVVTLSNRTASGVLTAAQTAVDRAGIIKFTTNAGLDFTLPNPSILVPLRVTVVNTGANSCTMYGLTIAAGAIAELLFDGADWRSYSQIAVVDYVVTDGSTAGASGKVPLPAAADFGKALTADASWARVQRLGDLAVADQAGAGVLITADQARTYRQITWTQTTVTLAFTLPTLAAADAGAELSVVAPAGFTATGVTLQGVSVIGSRAYRFHFNGTTWAQITQFTATNGTLVGQAGVVPAPVSGDYGKVLTADSTWSSAQRVGPSSPGNLSSGGALNTANTLRAFPYATWTQTTNSIAATLPNMLAGDAGFVFTLVAAGGFTATGCTIAGRAFGAGMTRPAPWCPNTW